MIEIPNDKYKQQQIEEFRCNHSEEAVEEYDQEEFEAEDEYELEREKKKEKKPSMDEVLNKQDDAEDNTPLNRPYKEEIKKQQQEDDMTDDEDAPTAAEHACPEPVKQLQQTSPMKMQQQTSPLTVDNLNQFNISQQHQSRNQQQQLQSPPPGFHDKDLSSPGAGSAYEQNERKLSANIQQVHDNNHQTQEQERLTSSDEHAGKEVPRKSVLLDGLDTTADAFQKAMNPINPPAVMKQQHQHHQQLAPNMQKSQNHQKSYPQTHNLQQQNQAAAATSATIMVNSQSPQNNQYIQQMPQNIMVQQISPHNNVAQNVIPYWPISI